MKIEDCRPEVQAFAILIEQRLRATRTNQTAEPHVLFERLETAVWDLQPHATLRPRGYINPSVIADRAGDAGRRLLLLAKECGALPAASNPTPESGVQDGA
jgi:hypothetical protein